MIEYVKSICNVGDLQPGMEVGKDVLTANGQIMLSEGTVLTANRIDGLRCWDIDSIIIRTPKEDTAPPQQHPAEDSMPAAFDVPISAAQQEFNQGYKATTSRIKSAFDNMRYFKEVPLNEMQDLANDSISKMIESVGIVNNLHMVQRQSAYTFHHSINVAVICGVLGKWLGFNGTSLSELVMAGLLHDVGKSQIPLEILDKPAALTPAEMKIMQSHTTLGYKMLKNNPLIPSSICMAVLQHHERADGNGYPLQVGQEKIHPYARIVAIADTYDAMTSDRVYHKKLTPFAVVETMLDEMYNKLDPDICGIFLNNVRNYFIGNMVRLSDGRQAEVVYLSSILANRPTIRTQNGEFIDLEKHKHLGIIELLEA